MDLIDLWSKDGLKNVRFSGGEPTIYFGIVALVKHAKQRGVERIAISTNGSASKDLYAELIEAGANDFSVSLDACCAEDGDHMAGGIKGAFNTVVENIKWLSERTYVTVGVVLTEDNLDKVNDIIRFSDTLGVSDIRIIPAAQNGDRFHEVVVDADLLIKYPILNYRIDNIQQSKPVRGLHDGDSHLCGLVLDDMAVNQGMHFPCIIYMREMGKEIGLVGPNMRQERLDWYLNTDVHNDPICKGNCLDVCRDFNIRFDKSNPLAI
jgi:molybdenum cofactor biosynthesis enzyme MoaA